jgi:predicted ATPase/DNA-binding CsgD family transcriptional regulator
MGSPVSVARIGNLPADTTSFLGRKGDTAEVRRLLSVSRLVTLTGVGGVGKTRLAVRVAAAVSGTFADGVWLVELEHVRDPTLVARTVCDALGVRDETGRDPVQVLTGYLRDRRLLLVLDNCEHLLEACRKLVEAVLPAAPAVRILSTGRERLHLPGECVWQVAPLSLPDPEQLLPPGAGARYPALLLFAERAAAAQPGFALTPENEAQVAKVCQLLDGIPLAIELVAVRLRPLSLEHLLARLSDRYWSLAAGRRGRVPRHQTLEAAVEWSFHLCTRQEQLLWARAAVFAGGFDLAAAEAVCSGDGLPTDHLGAVLTGLVDKSILVCEAPGGTVRYRLPQTLRQYGGDRLHESGRETELRHRHRDHYLALAEHDEANWFGAHQPEICVRIRREHPNLRAALEFCLESAGERRSGLRMAATLWFYWAGCGVVGEGRDWLDRTLSGNPEPGPDRARALWVAGYLGTLQGDLTAAVGMLEECRGYARQAGDEVALAYATHRLGSSQLVADDLDGAVALLEDAQRRYAGLAEMNSTVMLAGIELAVALVYLGDLDRAAALCEEGRAIGAAHGEQWAYAYALYVLALVSLFQGDPRRAQTLGRQSLRIKRTFNDLLGVVLAVEVLAWSAAADGSAERAAVLRGAGHRIWPSVGFPAFGLQRLAAPYRDCELIARRDLGDQRFEAAFRRGMALSADDAVAYALGEDDLAATGTAEPEPPRAVLLTPRELQVARLIGEGLSNREIADRLFISPRTVESHVQHILQKFGFGSRAQVVTWAAQQRGQ